MFKIKPLSEIPPIYLFDIPKFDFCDPISWFEKAEESFEKYSITTESQQFYLVVINLPLRDQGDLFNILQYEPTIQPYTKIKRILLREFKSSPNTFLRYITDNKIQIFKIYELISLLRGVEV